MADEVTDGIMGLRDGLRVMVGVGGFSKDD